MTTQTTTAARADIMQLTDDEIDTVAGGFIFGISPANFVTGLFVVAIFVGTLVGHILASSPRRSDPTYPPIPPGGATRDFW